MKIAIGADHAGYRLKQHLARFLERRDYQVEDQGAFSEESVDYPDFAAAVAGEIAAGRADLGLLVCGTGIGVAIAANKVDGIRAATCNDLFTAEKAREHNDANVLTIGARIVGVGLAEEIAERFMATAFTAGRHQRRVDKIQALE